MSNLDAGLSLVALAFSAGVVGVMIGDCHNDAVVNATRGLPSDSRGSDTSESVVCDYTRPSNRDEATELLNNTRRLEAIEDWLDRCH